MSRLARLVTLASGVVLAACSESGPPAPSQEAGAGPPPGADLACPDDVEQELLAPRCGNAGCHSAVDQVQDLDFESPGLAGRMAGAVGACARTILVPGEPDRSYLYSKVALAELSCGEPMPFGQARLSARELACIREWIEALPADAGAEPRGGPAVGGNGSGSDSGVPVPVPVDGGEADGAPVVAGPVCGDGEMACDGKCKPEVLPTLASIQGGIIGSTCVFESCHGGLVPKEALDLSSASASYDAMVGVASKQRPELLLVDPTSPETSYLIHKLRESDLPATSSSGDRTSERMPQPPNKPLCEEKIRVIEQWIRAGAAPGG